MAPTLRSASISYHFLPYTTIDIIIPLASSSTYIPTRVLHLYLTSIITNIGDRPGFINFVVLTTGNTQPGRSLTLLGFHNATVTTIVSKTDPLTVAQDLRSRGEYSYPSHITTVVLPPLEPTDLSGLLYNIPDLVNKAIANQHEYGAGDLCTQYRHKDVWVVSGDCATHYKERTGWSLLLDNVTSTPPQPSEHPHSVHQAPSSSPAPSSPTTIPIFPTLNLLFPPLPPPHTTCLTVSYDDSRFLPALLLTYLPSICTSAILLVGTTPWDTHGSANEPRTMTPTVIRLSRAITKLEKQGYNEVSVVRGSWPNEAAQRNAGQQLARMRGATSVFVVDGDEYYEVEEIQRILELNEQSRKGRYEQLIASEAARIASLISHYDIPTTPTTIVSSTVPPSLYATPFLFSPMLTYFGGMSFVVDPPEKLMALFLASPTCDFTEARALSCPGTGAITYSDSNANVYNGLAYTGPAVDGVYLSRDDLVCHHFSYVRTDTELMSMKFASFHHADEFDNDHWFNSVWREWKGASQGLLTDLHPTVPAAYKGTRKIANWEKSSLGIAVDNECEMGRKAAPNVPNDVWDLMCEDYMRGSKAQAAVKPSEVDEEYIESVTREIKEAHEVRPEQKERGQQTSSKVRVDAALFSVQGEDAMSKHGSSAQLYTTVQTQDLEYGDMVELDEFMGETEKFYDMCESPAFVIVIVEEGEFDTATFGVFEPIAKYLKEGLESLFAPPQAGAPPRVIISRCRDLRFCKLEGGGRYNIVLGAHHLARYKDGEGVVASLAADFPKRGRTVVYNFEHAKSQVDFDVLGMWEVLEYYKPHVWEYGRDNFGLTLEKLGEGGVSYVPLGFVQGMEGGGREREGGGEEGEVVFYGRLNERRERVIKELREGGVRVRHVNAVDDVYGLELEEIILGSAIVLNLGYFGSREEWKMTRCVFPLANEVLVVSEVLGSVEELEYWGDGIVFTDDLVASVKYYLRDAAARKRVSKIGKEKLMAVQYRDVLVSPVLKLLQDGGGCRQL